MKNSQREIWVDNVKVIACFLVLSGHCLMGLAVAGIVDSPVLDWFIQTIYYFHVPLFFICSGYLYQRGGKSHWPNVLHKLIALGVPYLTFSFATWALKTVFSGQVNTEMQYGLFDTLFLNPTGPYWFLYTLFFVFLITPRFKSVKICAVALAGSIVLKLAAPYIHTGIYAVSSVLGNELWFVGGMLLNMCDLITKLQSNAKKVIGGGYILLALFIAASIAVFKYEIGSNILSFILGLAACAAIIAIVMGSFADNEQNAVAGFFAKYTMPIFLMHTIFAAPTRIVLMKLGLNNILPQALAGITASIVGPIIAAMIMEKTKYLEFFIYPGKFIGRKN